MLESEGSKLLTQEYSLLTKVVQQLLGPPICCSVKIAPSLYIKKYVYHNTLTMCSTMIKRMGFEEKQIWGLILILPAIGYIPIETDSETRVSQARCLRGLPLRSTLQKRGEGSRNGQRKKLHCGPILLTHKESQSQHGPSELPRNVWVKVARPLPSIDHSRVALSWEEV